MPTKPVQKLYVWLIVLALFGASSLIWGEDTTVVPLARNEVMYGSRSGFVAPNGWYRIDGIPLFDAWRVRSDGLLTINDPQPYSPRYLIEGYVGRSEYVTGRTGGFGDAVVVPKSVVWIPSNAPIIGGRVRQISIEWNLDYYSQRYVRLIDGTMTFDPGGSVKAKVVLADDEGNFKDITDDPATMFTITDPVRFTLGKNGSMYCSFPKPGEWRVKRESLLVVRYEGLAYAKPIAASGADDTDGDGIPDSIERYYNLGEGDVDTDGDGWTDRHELQVTGTNPSLADTDGDGISDASDPEPKRPESIAPVIQITSPVTAAVYDPKAQELRVQGNVSDNVGLRRLRIFSNGETLYQEDIIGTNSKILDVAMPISDISPLAAPSVTVEVFDIAGNRSAAQRRIILRPTPPVLTMLSPVLDVEIEPGTEVLISADAVDEHGLSRFDLAVDGQPFTSTLESHLQALLSVAADRTSPILLTLTAVDSLGNESVLNQLVSVRSLSDNEGPSLVLSHGPGATFAIGSTVRVSVQASDASAIASIELESNGGTLVATSTPGQWDFTAPGAPTTVTVTARARDDHGNISEENLTWQVVLPDELINWLAPTADVPLVGGLLYQFDVALPAFLSSDEFDIHINGRRMDGYVSGTTDDGRNIWHSWETYLAADTKSVNVTVTLQTAEIPYRRVSFARNATPWPRPKLKGQTYRDPQTPVEDVALFVNGVSHPLQEDGSFIIELTNPPTRDRWEIEAAWLGVAGQLQGGAAYFWQRLTPEQVLSGSIPAYVYLYNELPDSEHSFSEEASLGEALTWGSNGLPLTKMWVLPSGIAAVTAEGVWDRPEDPMASIYSVEDLMSNLEGESDVAYLTGIASNSSQSVQVGVFTGRLSGVAQASWLSYDNWGNSGAYQLRIGPNGQLNFFARSSLSRSRNDGTTDMYWIGKKYPNGDWEGLFVDEAQKMVWAGSNVWSYTSEEERYDYNTGEWVTYEVTVNQNDHNISVVTEGTEAPTALVPQPWFETDGWNSVPGTSSAGALIGRILLMGEPVEGALLSNEKGDTVRSGANGYFYFDKFDNDINNFEPRVFHRLYVRSDAPPDGDGSTWAQALQTLDQAAHRAYNGTEVWVAGGTYIPETRDIIDDPRSASLVLPPNTTWIAGFIGNEIDRELADPHTRPVIISGEIGQTGDVEDNVRNILRVNAGVTLEGFTIERCFGGSAITMEGPATLRHCIIRDNDAELVDGGGIEVLGGASVLEHCVLSNNKANTDTAISVSSASLRIYQSVIVGCNGSASLIGVHNAGSIGLDFCTISTNGPIEVEAGTQADIFASIWDSPSAQHETDVALGMVQWRACLVPLAVSNSSIMRVGTPNFVNVDQPAGLDGLWGTADDGLALDGSSTAINLVQVLDNDFGMDFLGYSRNGGLAPDAGAYEYKATSAAAPIDPLPNQIGKYTLGYIKVSLPGDGEAWEARYLDIFPNQMNVIEAIELQPPEGFGFKRLNDPDRPLLAQGVLP